MSKIILGLQFGDEGKGVTVSSLSNSKTLVVRFNGGHQAGHTVEQGDYRHVFSSFGSGTLKGAATYWSEYCTFYPKSFVVERNKLMARGHDPRFFIHPLAMVTTPWDIMHNQEAELRNLHGSVGVGFGSTVARHEKSPHKLYAIDLKSKSILERKLRGIASYYGKEWKAGEMEQYMQYVESIDLSICHLNELSDLFDEVIFEGAQGILLDQEFGYFPNVTRSNTTSKNAIEIIAKNGITPPDIYYVMRSYLTRHGNGYMPYEDKELKFTDKTNTTHQFQGSFRQGWHSMEHLNYAIRCDKIFSQGSKRHLVITCLDQTDNMVYFQKTKMKVEEFVDKWSIFDSYIIKSYAETV